MSSMQYACMLWSKANRSGPYDRASDERRKSWVIVSAASIVSWQNFGHEYSQRGNDYIRAAFFFGTAGFSSHPNLSQESNVGKLRRLVGEHLDAMDGPGGGVSLQHFFSPHLCVGFLFLVLYPAASFRLLPPPPPPSARTQLVHTPLVITQLAHTHLVLTNLSSHNLHTHTQLVITHLVTTQLAHTTCHHTSCHHTTSSHTTCHHTTYSHITCSHTTCHHTTYTHTTYSHTTCHHTFHTHTQLTHTQLAHTQLTHT